MCSMSRARKAEERYQCVNSQVYMSWRDKFKGLMLCVRNQSIRTFFHDRGLGRLEGGSSMSPSLGLSHHAAKRRIIPKPPLLPHAAASLVIVATLAWREMLRRRLSKMPPWFWGCAAGS